MSNFRLYVVPQAWDELQRLPGHIKHRVRNAIDNLLDDPYPSISKRLDYPSGVSVAVFRLRIDKWRIVYAVNADTNLVSIVAVRKRPPYDYQDLAALLEDLL